MNNKWLAVDFGIFGVTLLLLGIKWAIVYGVYAAIMHWQFDKD